MKMKRFKDNEHYNAILGPYGDVYVDAISWLYNASIIGARARPYLLCAYKVPIYDFLNDVFVIVEASLSKHPKVSIEERVRHTDYDSHFYIEECVWAAFIWMSLKSLSGENDGYSKSLQALKEVLKEESGIDPYYFEKNHFLWTKTADTLEAIRDGIKQLPTQTLEESIPDNKGLEKEIEALKKEVKEKDAIIENYKKNGFVLVEDEVSEPSKVYDDDLKNLKLSARTFIILFQELGIDFADINKFERGKSAKLIAKILGLTDTREVQKNLEALSGDYTNHAFSSLSEKQRDNILRLRNLAQNIIDEIKKDNK